MGDTAWGHHNITLELVGVGLEQGWTPDRNIVIFRMRDNSHDVLDMWAKKVTQVMLTWAKDEPYLAIYDAMQFAPHMALTPYFRQKTIEVAQNIPRHTQGRYAVLVNPSPLLTIGRTFAKIYMKRLLPNLEGNFCYSYDEALPWLRQALPAAKNGA